MLKIAILASEHTFQINSLIEESNKRTNHIEIIELGEIEITQLQTDPMIKRLSEFDVVYLRDGCDQVTKMALGKELVKRNIRFINSGYYLNPLLSDKRYQTCIAVENGLIVPKTITTKKLSPEIFSRLVERLGTPFIAKPAIGCKGIGVEMITKYEDLDHLVSNSKKLIFQKFIPNDGDFRIIVIGGKSAGIFKRVPSNPNEFRANISQGGHGELVDNTELKGYLFAIAEKISKALNLEVAGIDIILSKKDKKLYFLESNSVPQWEGFEKTTGINVPGLIIDFLETQK